jgi:iron complex transport system permease protein
MNHSPGRRPQKTPLLWLALLLLIMAVALASGSGQIQWHSLWGTDPEGQTSRLLFWQLRFPRVLCAAVVGAALAVTGCVLQTMLRNPLADPFLIGISSASATGTVVALALGWYDARYGLAALAALSTLLFLDNIAFRQQRFSDHHLLVAGVALTYLFSALTGLLVALSKPEATRGMLFWLMGGFSAQDPLGTGLALGTLAGAGLFLAARANDLDLLAAGDETAHVLGLRPDRLRRQLFRVRGGPGAPSGPSLLRGEPPSRVAALSSGRGLFDGRGRHRGAYPALAARDPGGAADCLAGSSLLPLPAA